MNKSLVLTVAMLALSGCASQTLNTALPKLQGEKIDYVFQYLGYPDSEQTIAGKKVYTWAHSQTTNYTASVPTSYSGNIYGTGGSAYYTGQTMTDVPQTLNFQCKIRLMVDKKEIIRDWTWSGNAGGCDYYAHGLSRLAN